MFLLSINWPPPVYKMPTYTPYDASTLSSVFEILKNSLKSMTNTGLLILGACLAAGAIFSVVGSFVRRALALEDGVRRNMFRREVGNLDIKRNSGDIAINREMNMHMNFLARKLYHKLHREDEIEEGIYKRELAHEVDQRIKEKHPEWAIERRMDSAEAERQYREQTRQQRLEDFIRRTREKDEFEAALRQQNRERAAQRIVQRRLDSMEADKVLRREYRDELVENRAEGIAISKAAKIRYREMQDEERYTEAYNQTQAILKAREERLQGHQIEEPTAQETEVNPVTGEVTHKPRRRRKKK